jgi:hypothetical protein
MRTICLALAIAGATTACSDDSSSSLPIPTPSCDGANITPADTLCAIDFGTCSDESSYALACAIETNGLQCSCEINSVEGGPSDVVFIAGGTCDASLTSPELVQAWLDCGVKMSLGSGS